MKILLLILCAICTIRAQLVQFEETESDACTMIAKSKYMARICTGSNTIHIQMINPSVTEQITTFQYDNVIDTDFTDDEIFITHKANETSPEYVFDIYSFRECDTLVSVGCIQSKTLQFDMLSVTQDDKDSSSQSVGNHTEDPKNKVSGINKLKFARLLGDFTVVVVAERSHDKDQIIVIDYDISTPSSPFVDKVKSLDIQIDKICNIMVLNKITLAQDKKISMMLVDGEGVFMAFYLTPKSYRITLPTKQSRSPQMGKVTQADVVALEEYVLIKLVNQTHTVLEVLERGDYTSIFKNAFSEQIAGISAYSFTKEYTMMLYSIAKNLSKTKNDGIKVSNKIEAVHIAKTDGGYYTTQRDEDILIPQIMDSQAIMSPNNGSIYIYDRLKINPLEFDSQKCALQPSAHGAVALENTGISEMCVERTEKLFMGLIHKAVKEKDSSEAFLMVAFLSTIMIILILLGTYAVLTVYDKYRPLQDIETPEVQRRNVNVYVQSSNELKNPNELCSICVTPLLNKGVNDMEMSIDFVEKSMREAKSTRTSRRMAKASINLSEQNTLDGMERNQENQYVDNIDVEYIDPTGNSDRGSNRSKEEQSVVTLYYCEHSFHQDCIEKWLKRSSSCPLCRVNVWEQPS